MSRTAITLIEKSLGYLTVNDEIELERKRHAAAHVFADCPDKPYARHRRLTHVNAVFSSRSQWVHFSASDLRNPKPGPHASRACTAPVLDSTRRYTH